ncbi:TPA: hypothetical protein ACKS27_001076, partial [Neisseria gonorrhoeae]
IKRTEPCSVQNSVPESRLIKLSDFLGCSSRATVFYLSERGRGDVFLDVKKRLRPPEFSGIRRR